jgi:hypothetical protein
MLLGANVIRASPGKIAGHLDSVFVDRGLFSLPCVVYRCQGRVQLDLKGRDLTKF